jgi:tetratricopeptide (TPR) repeat protein
VAESLDRLSYALNHAGHPADARAVSERAVRILEDTSDHPSLAHALLNLAAAIQNAGDHEQAIAVNERALAIQRERLRPDHPDIGRVLRDMGTSYAALGQRERARDVLERALGMFRAASLSPDEIAYVQLELAKVTADEDPVRAREFAAAARNAYLEAHRDDAAADAVAWLSSHTEGESDAR